MGQRPRLVMTVLFEPEYSGGHEEDSILFCSTTHFCVDLWVHVYCISYCLIRNKRYFGLVYCYKDVRSDVFFLT